MTIAQNFFKLSWYKLVFKLFNLLVLNSSLIVDLFKFPVVSYFHTSGTSLGFEIVGANNFFLSRWCLIIIWTGLNFKIGIVQKVYEWPSWYFAKMILKSGDHFGKRTAWSFLYLLNYVYSDIYPSRQILGNSPYE